MSEYRSTLERELERLSPPRIPFDQLVRRRDRKHRDQRIRAGVLGLVVAIAVSWWLINEIRSTPPVPADRSEQLGIFAPVAGRILYENSGVDRGYDPGFWAVDPSGPYDTTEGLRVADDVASTLVPLELDGTPLGWSSDGTDLLLMRTVGASFPEQYLYVLHADGSETQLNSDPMVFARGVHEAAAAIAPDGSRVVYATEGLQVVDAEGGRPVRLPSSGDASAPTFSPDGAQIAYIVGDDELWVANADGTDAHKILGDEAPKFLGFSGLQWSPAGDRLAIGLGMRKGDGRPAIYTFAPDGSDFTQVITGGTSPYWSPDGSQIAFTIPCDEQPDGWCPEGSILRSEFDPQPGDRPAGLAIADADGSNVRAFGFAASGPWHPGTSAQPNEPAPVPSETFARANGEVLSFTGSSEAPGDLVAVNPATGEERVLVQDLDGVSSARWSADGRWVAYEDAGTEGHGLWVVSGSQEPRQVATDVSRWMWSSAGAELATIRGASYSKPYYSGATLSTIDPVTGETTDVGSIPDDVGDTSAPVWAPDGTRFVFGARGGAIYSVDIRSGASSLLVQLPGQHLDSVDQIAWSPDGAHIAVMNDQRPPGNGRLYVMDADGSNVRVLLDQYVETGIAWSPDGTRLAYEDQSGVIWAAPMEGSAPTEIGTSLGGSRAGVLLNQDDLTWSPDGSRIGYRDIGFRAGADIVTVSAIDADGRNEAERIDDLTYRSWDGGWYSCDC